jgi:hypothetical protein
MWSVTPTVGKPEMAGDPPKASITNNVSVSVHHSVTKSDPALVEGRHREGLKRPSVLLIWH